MTPKVSETDVLVGQRLRLRRKELKLSQGSVAQAAGITFQQIQKYKAGTNRIGAGRLETISTFLGVPVSYFFASQDAKGADRPDGASGAHMEPGAIELLKAYAAIESADDQKAVLNFARKLARGPWPRRRDEPGRRISMRTVATKEDAERLVAERKNALDEAKAVNAEPGNHVRGSMHVRQAAEALEMAKEMLAKFKRPRAGGMKGIRDEECR